MKKILCIVPYTFLPAKTGGQKAIASLYENLSKHFRLVCIGTEKNDTSKAQGYKMYNILSASPLRYINLFNVFKIKKIILKERPDYLQLEHPYLGWLAIALKKITGIKIIIRSHNIEGLRFKSLHKWWWKILYLYEKWVYVRANLIFFISPVDRAYAIEAFHLSPSNTYTITFGINFTDTPPASQLEAARTFLLESYGLDKDIIIILFNGAFGYAPNLNGLINLIKNIFPLLKKLSEKKFKLIVCGKDIPSDLIRNNTNRDIIYAGFVADINTYLSGVTIFVNPITEGGGIKTKLVEALGFNLNCVSYKTGAIGVASEVCGQKLIIVPDNKAEEFAKAILTASEITSDIPAAFYAEYSNEKIVEKIKGIL